MTQSIKIGSTNYSNLRAAIKAATTGQQIDIGDGLYDIRSSATNFTPIPDPTKLANPNTFARFGTKTLTFSGLGNGVDPTANTIITGNARIYTGQSDRGSGIPASITLKTLRLSYGESLSMSPPYSSPNGSGYILQSGDKSYIAGFAINNRIGVVSLDGVSFAGIHSGAVGTAGGAPFGNYMDVAVSTSLTFNNINVALTGQGGGNFFANNPTTYGSAFLLANGPQITVTNSTFNEAGYRNALSLWGQPGFATNVTISNNTFTRTANQVIRTAGETLSGVTGSVIDNTFEQGVYLDLQNLNLATGSLGITGGNDFFLLQGGYGIVIRDGQTSLTNLAVSGNTFTGGLAVLNQISTPSVLSFGSNDVNGLTFSGLLVGGAAADTITGTSAKEWISGGDGADTLTGGASADAFVFAKPGAADTITDYSGLGGDGDQIWLDDAAFTGLTTVAGPTAFLNQLSASDYGTDFISGKHIIYNGNALWYDADGVTGGEVKITNFSPAASPAPFASNILIF
jgi:hypothetical protein